MSRLIYIEDESSIRLNYSEILEEAGHDVVAFESAPDVGALFEHSTPDLFLLDVSLGNDEDAGFDLCRRILQQDPDARIAFLTTRTDPKDKEHAMSIGAAAYICKEEPVSVLLHRIEAILNNRENA